MAGQEKALHTDIPPDVAIDHLFPPYTKEKVQALDRWFDY